MKSNLKKEALGTNEIFAWQVSNLNTLGVAVGGYDMCDNNNQYVMQLCTKTKINLKHTKCH